MEIRLCPRSFVRHYLDRCLAVDLSAQFRDNFGCGAKKFEDLIPNLRHVFIAIRRSGMRFSPGKYHLGTKFLRKFHHKKRTKKIDRFLKNLRMPVTIKQVKRLIGFFHFLRNFFYQILNKNIFPFSVFFRETLISPLVKSTKRALHFSTLISKHLRKQLCAKPNQIIITSSWQMLALIKLTLYS